MRMPTRILSLTLLALFTLSMLVSAQRRTPTPATPLEIREINAYAKRVDDFIKGNPKTFRIFANVASGRKHEPDQWREFKSEGEMEKAATGDNLNESAYVWRQEQGVVGVNLTLTSPSGDWVHFVMYYFRKDGTLAKIQARLNTFYGDFTVLNDKFYSAKGKLLHTTTKYLDLVSRKPKKRERDFPNFPIPVYRRQRELPFYDRL